MSYVHRQYSRFGNLIEKNCIITGFWFVYFFGKSFRIDDYQNEHCSHKQSSCFQNLIPNPDHYIMIHWG